MKVAPPELLRPVRLRAGDRVAVIAPSGPVPRETFEAGARLLAGRYQLCFDEALFSRGPAAYLAGSDERRGAELIRALTDPSIRAIVCARGGYGAARLLDRLPPSLITQDPKPLCGFSDITALHAAWLRAGLSSLHGPVVTHLGKLDAPEATAAEVMRCLESTEPPPPWTGLGVLRAGEASGVAVGGNLEVLSRLVGTPQLPPLDGAVLFLEEIAERPYRLDRQLTHLRAAGLLDRVCAVVLGDFVRCDEPDGSITSAEVLSERLGGLGVPVVTGAPFGHGERNRPFIHGGRVRVIAAREGGSSVAAGVASVEFLEGLVS